MSRLERLVNLIAALLSAQRPMTAEELRDRVPGYPPEKASFRRQFERDKDALRDLGVPLQTITTPGDSLAAYVVLADEYELRDPGLEPDELDALNLAAQMVRIEGMATDEGLWKLSVEPRGEASRPPPSEVPSATLPTSEALAAVFAAIAEGRAMAFTYRGETRDVVAQRLSFRNGHWYLSAHDRDRSASRSFRLDRIDSVVELRERAEVPSDERAGAALGDVTRSFNRPWELGEGPVRRALVRIDAAQSAWVVNHLGPGSLFERHDDGSVTLALDVANADAFRSFVLGFLDHAVILDPPELREELVAWVSNAAERDSR